MAHGWVKRAEETLVELEENQSKTHCSELSCSLKAREVQDLY